MKYIHLLTCLWAYVSVIVPEHMCTHAYGSLRLTLRVFLNQSIYYLSSSQFSSELGDAAILSRQFALGIPSLHLPSNWQAALLAQCVHGLWKSEFCSSLLNGSCYN